MARAIVQDNEDTVCILRVLLKETYNSVKMCIIEMVNVICIYTSGQEILEGNS